MNYTASVSDFFKSPKWMMNLLLAGVCGLIPFLGQIVIKGWLITGFWGREDERCETFPDFDFSKFGKYLERGLWPYLVTLVSGMVLGMLLAFCIGPVAMFSALFIPNQDAAGSGCIAAFMAIMMIVFYFVLLIGTMFVLTPLTLRASITQDFAQSFNFAFVKRFVALVWKEIILSSAFLVVASVLLACVGVLALCIGLVFATVPIYFCWVHLHKQLYALYLSRGGEPIPLSPKLRDYAAPAV
jgi:uncharacterized protein DUF4013